MSVGFCQSPCVPGKGGLLRGSARLRSEEHTSELQSQSNLVCRLLLEKKKKDHGSTRGRHPLNTSDIPHVSHRRSAPAMTSVSLSALTTSTAMVHVAARGT